MNLKLLYLPSFTYFGTLLSICVRLYNIYICIYVIILVDSTSVEYYAMLNHIKMKLECLKSNPFEKMFENNIIHITTEICFVLSGLLSTIQGFQKVY